MIKITDIHKRFDSLEVLKGVNMTVNDGEILSIIGPSGAGKTTLLQIIGSLDRPDKGTVEYGQQNIFNLSEKQLAHFRNGNIGFVFQFHQLLAEFSLLENVALPALIAGRARSEAEAEARELIDYLGLSARISHRPAQLSGGERQRAAVARALVNHPQVVLADEPSGSLDSHNRRELHQLFFDLRDRYRQTFVIVTHDEELARQADRTIEMRDGRVTDVINRTRSTTTK